MMPRSTRLLHPRPLHGLRHQNVRPLQSSSSVVENAFANHTRVVLDVARRALKFSCIGLFAIASTVGTAYAGAHLWVEYVGMASEQDEQVKKWQWDLQNGRWNGRPDAIGTDPALGFKGRHNVRSAWMAHNWGVGGNQAAAATNMHLTGPGISVVDVRSLKTEEFLRAAISIADAQGTLDLHPDTLPFLIWRHATALQKLGIAFLPEAKVDLERAWTALSAGGLFASQIAYKLGDISSRLGHIDAAVVWWNRAIALAQGGTYDPSRPPTSLTPKVPPNSPFAQRILSNCLVSLSAHYAQSRCLKEAEAIENSTLELLRSLSKSLASTTAPEALHALYLLQRSSLISLHLGEVLYAQRRSDSYYSSVQWLTSAAESSERVANALTGLQLRHDLNLHSNIHIPIPDLDKGHLCSVYANSSSMRQTASTLLRDSRRTAAEAWHLIGTLYESQEGLKSRTALDCYERAVKWAGKPTDDPNIKLASDDTLQTEWDVFWDDYRRLRDSQR